MTPEEFIGETGGTGAHLRICLAIDDGPDYIGRSIQKPCQMCERICWYDPKSSIYPPGEIIICTRCLGTLAS